MSKLSPKLQLALALRNKLDALHYDCTDHFKEHSRPDIQRHISDTLVAIEGLMEDLTLTEHDILFSFYIPKVISDEDSSKFPSYACGLERYWARHLKLNHNRFIAPKEVKGLQLYFHAFHRVSLEPQGNVVSVSPTTGYETKCKLYPVELSLDCTIWGYFDEANGEEPMSVVKAYANGNMFSVRGAGK